MPSALQPVGARYSAFCCVGHTLSFICCVCVVSSCRRPRCRRLCKRWVPLPLLFPVLVTLSLICCVCGVIIMCLVQSSLQAVGAPSSAFSCVDHSLIDMLCLVSSCSRRPRWFERPANAAQRHYASAELRYCICIGFCMDLVLMWSYCCHHVGAGGVSGARQPPLNIDVIRGNLGTVCA